MTEAKELALRTMTRMAISSAIERDLEGDEQLLKEVWEACEGRADTKVVADEGRKILALIDGSAQFVVSDRGIDIRPGPNDCNCGMAERLRTTYQHGHLSSCPKAPR